MNRLTMLVIGGATLVALIGCRTYGARQDFNLAAPWGDYQRMVVHNRNGSVALSTADVTEIRISGTKHASAPTLAEAESNLERLIIRAEPDSRDPAVFVVELEYPKLLTRGSVGANLEIQVPAPCAADIRTSNGGVAVSGLTDEARLKTSNGRISVDSITGAVHARTDNGAIVLENVTGDLTAVTSSGEIRAKVIRGNCELETSNGSVRAEDVHGSVEAATSNGKIHVDATPPEGGRVALRTTNGSIHATLPADLKGDLDLKTTNGIVRAALGDVPLKVQLWSQNRVKAKMNGGGGVTITAVTTNGLVTVESR